MRRTRRLLYIMMTERISRCVRAEKTAPCPVSLHADVHRKAVKEHRGVERRPDADPAAVGPLHTRRGEGREQHLKSRTLVHEWWSIRLRLLPYTYALPTGRLCRDANAIEKIAYRHTLG